MIKPNITNKLEIIIIGGIISLAICLGIYFDNYLKESVSEISRSE